MKNTKITKIALLVLSVALLLGTVIGFTVNAEDAEYGIIAKNVIYGDRTNVVFAVNATVEEAVAGTVKVAYKWGEDGEVKTATLLDTTVSDNLYEGHPAFAIDGVALKELGNVAYATVYTGDAPAEDAKWVTYSAAEYFYAKLYKDGFVNKGEADGKDYNRKLLYGAMLESGKQAQLVLDYNKDKLVSDYSYVYTTSELINFNGAKTVFGYGELQVNATVIGEGTIAGWTLTAKDGAETTLDTVILTATGVYKAEPVFGTHECADEDKDHVCDSCGEVASECVNNNATVDHKCDICGKVVDACADANTDGKCDVCKTYLFEVESMSSSSGITFVNIAANSGSDYTAASGTVGTSSRPEGYTKGTWLYLAADPTNSANKVLASNSISAGSMTDDAISDVIFTPDVQVEGGDLVVLEYDYYVDGCTNNKNSKKFIYNYADSTTTRANATYATSAGVRLVADPDGLERWALDTWVKVRLVCDNTNKKIYTFVCTDGESFVQCETVTPYSAASSTITSVGFTYVGYGVASTQYYDNIICVQTTAEAYGITLK